MIYHPFDHVRSVLALRASRRPDRASRALLLVLREGPCVSQFHGSRACANPEGALTLSGAAVSGFVT